MWLGYAPLVAGHDFHLPALGKHGRGMNLWRGELNYAAPGFNTSIFFCGRFVLQTCNCIGTQVLATATLLVQKVSHLMARQPLDMRQQHSDMHVGQHGWQKRRTRNNLFRPEKWACRSTGRMGLVENGRMLRLAVSTGKRRKNGPQPTLQHADAASLLGAVCRNVATKRVKNCWPLPTLNALNQAWTFPKLVRMNRPESQSWPYDWVFQSHPQHGIGFYMAYSIRWLHPREH